MFTPKRSTNLTNAGSSSARVTRSQSLKTKNELTPRLSSGASGASASTIFNDALLEPYKTPLPIRISELISQSTAQDISQFNSNILPNGHVCFVTEKKVFIWKLRKSYKNIQCNELTLPSSRHRVKPNCIFVDCYNNKDYIAICATVEGTLRYWPSIFNEFSYIEGRIDFSAGDEATHLMALSRNSFLLITSNGQLWSLNIELVNGQITIVTKFIDASNGLFSGIGRRMTSFIFGGASGKNTPSFKSAERFEDSNEVFILCDKMLQKWRTDGNVSLVYQSNMEKLLFEAYTAQKPNFTKCTIMFQDASITKNSLYVLAVVEDNDLQFVVGEVDTHPNQAENKLKSFHILNHKVNLRRLDDLQNLYHIQAIHNQHAFYLYDSNSVVFFTGPTLEMSGESKFQKGNDRIIACGLCENELLFFSLNNGIVKARDSTISLNIPEEDTSLLSNATLIDNRPSLSQSFGLAGLNASAAAYQDLSNVSMQSGDESFSHRFSSQRSIDFTMNNISPDQTALMRYKAAFQLYLRKDEKESQSVLDELFNDATNLSVDLLTVELSEKLIDDVPLHDPRWAELNNKSGKSLNSNLIISNQLNGKIRIHEYFLSFLKAFGLWRKLNTVVYNNREILTRLALKEHGEKLHCALMIREQLYAKYSDLINSAIEYTIKNREDITNKLVYPHDVFYRRVSKIDDIFNSLVTIEQDMIRNNNTEQAITYLIDTTFSFIKILKTSLNFNQEKSQLYKSQNDNESKIEHVRWTYLPLKEITTASGSVINLCVRQHKLCVDYGLLNCNSMEKKSIMLQQLYELDMIIFDEYELRLSSIDLTREQRAYKTEYLAFEKSYDSLKTKLIEVFVKNKLTENALELAEKYVDFQTLVYLCELSEDYDLLKKFLDKFSNRDFADFVVSYFTDKKKLNFLLKNELIKRTDISRCLDNYKVLSWMKDAKNENFSNAAQTLEDLAIQENDSYAKRKTLLSLSKLSLLASGDSRDSLSEKLALINRRLAYLSYIDRLPPNIIKNSGLDYDLLPKFKPEKLIDLYITYEEATEYEYKIALEILDYINDDNNAVLNNDEIYELKIKIFAKSILADNWNVLFMSEDPELELKKTRFYKTIELVKESNDDLETILPDISDLFRYNELEPLTSNERFEYLIRSCYELFLL